MKALLDAVAGVWGYALSPISVLLLSAVALWAAGHHGWTVALGAVILVDNALLAVLG